MKKRQKPILLVTLLVVFVAAAIGMNFLSDPNRASEVETPPMTSESREGDHSNIGSSVASKMGGSTPPPKKGMAMAPNGPRGLIKKGNTQGPIKPKPSDSSVNSQWYAK
jgi:hypothetical protein